MFYVILFAGVVIYVWQADRESAVMAKVLNNIPETDSIVVKDNDTEKKLAVVTDTDHDFAEMVDFYHIGHDLSWKEKKLFKGKPVYDIDFRAQNETLFTIGVYEVRKASFPHSG